MRYIIGQKQHVRRIRIDGIALADECAQYPAIFPDLLDVVGIADGSGAEERLYGVLVGEARGQQADAAGTIVLGY